MTELSKFVSSSLKKLADRDKAKEMAAYMKSSIPFYGVQQPDRKPIVKELKLRFKAQTQDEYEKNVLELWRLPHREEKYIALNYAELFPEFIGSSSMHLYESLIREGSWWDFVDTLSTRLAGKAYFKERKLLKPLINSWAHDKSMWIRRASLLVHIGHKDDTDSKQLFQLCLQLAPESEFFIQKAIGWTLREYAKSDPQAVRRFLKVEKSRLAPLSFREASKHLI